MRSGGLSAKGFFHIMMQSRPDHSFVPGLADDRLTRPAVTGDMAVASLFGQLGDLLARMPGAWGRTGRRGTRLVMTGTPGETFNGIFSSASVPDVEEVAELAGCLIGRDERWSIFSRTEPVTELLELAAKHGLTHQTRQPVMVRGTEPVRAEPGEPDSPIVRRVADTDIEAYLDVLASVTGNPRKPQSDQMFVDLFAIPETKAICSSITVNRRPSGSAIPVPAWSGCTTSPPAPSCATEATGV